MQCQKHVWRSTCGSHKAYNLAHALRATFADFSIPQAAAYEKKNKVVSIKYYPRDSPNDREGRGGEDVRKREEEYVGRRGEDQKKVKTGESARGRNAKSIRMAKSDSWQKGMHTIRQSLDREAALRRQSKTEGDVSQGNPYSKDMSGTFDYKPAVIMPQIPPVAAYGTPPPPWAHTSKHAYAGAKPWRMFAMEMVDFVEWIELTPMEKIARKAVLDETLALMRETAPALEGKMKLHGSEKTGLSLPFSDLDIQIGPLNVSVANKIVQQLYAAFRSSDKFLLAVHRRGPHPILNVQHRETGIAVQITAGSIAGKQEEIVRQYLAEIPHLRQLFFVIRSFFDLRDLNNVYCGGLGSYGIFILLAAALKRASTASPKHTHQDTYWIQLKSFFDTYNPSSPTAVDLTKHGIACCTPRFRFLKHTTPYPTLLTHARAAKASNRPIRSGQWRICARSDLQPYLLCLQDPADPRNDLGRKSHAIKHILHTMKYFAEGLEQDFEEMTYFPEDWVGRSVLEPLVGRPDLVYREQRRKVEEFGRMVSEERLSEAEELVEKLDGDEDGDEGGNGSEKAEG